MLRRLDSILLALVLVGFASWSMADGLPNTGLAKATGQFHATDECPMFQSKRQGTNPGNLKTSPEVSYPVREVIMAGGTPEWLRLDSGESVQEPLRWVEARCGQVSALAATAGSGSSDTGGTGCNVADTYDSHVLALSWQPGFCEKVRPDLNECRTQTVSRFDASHFALHGLWPNKNVCNRRYGYCGTVTGEPRSGDKCDHPALTMDADVRAQLAVIMPSVASGTCLQRHEYWKHGTCRDKDPDAYYRLSIALTRQVNDSQLVTDFFQPNIGKTVTRTDFDKAFDESFGANAHKHVSMNCRGGFLTEMQIALPKDIPFGAKLPDLLPTAATRKVGSCGRQFFIDPAGFGSN